MPRLVPPVLAPGALASSAQPTLAADDDLILRRFEPDDVPAVLDAFADPAVQRWNLRRLDDPDEAADWVLGTHAGWSSETAATWAARTADGAVAVRVTLYLRLAAGQGEVTYWVLPSARGRGVAARAVRAVTDWAHGAGFQRLEIRHSVENPGSCRVAERAGYPAEGTLRRALLHDDGWHDMHLHAHVVDS
ncbi:GNAT family N-acetyltransferase [Iamia sp. SCSIO 61187]|uniref:GNAT family N-acetyltransferase n=1 Tax=Iamia sp. SCSIO 61187 TaxID=2722752 RepID=UPI001C62D2F5|nr:GNAT family N-acetyltransferase [Iamia sp. SCSIO 61187]QYG93117.1 GNAT family N-acetyltransferase [Iamia sp. SCSIO 61187]